MGQPIGALHKMEVGDNLGICTYFNRNTPNSAGESAEVRLALKLLFNPQAQFRRQPFRAPMAQAIGETA